MMQGQIKIKPKLLFIMLYNLY